MDEERLSEESLRRDVHTAGLITDTINTPGFQFLMAQLESEHDVALNQLKSVDPHDAKAVAKLQFVCWRYDEIVIRMGDIRENGHTAELELTFDPEA